MQNEQRRSVSTEEGEDYEKLYKEADSALYVTKNHGKAAFTLYEEKQRTEPETASRIVP